MTRVRPQSVFLFVIGLGILAMQAFLTPEPNLGLVLIGVAAVGYVFVTDLPPRFTSGTTEPINPCTGGELCACYPCTVKALFPADREWLARHGWQEPDVIRQPAGPKRSTWKTHLDVEMERELHRLVEKRVRTRKAQTARKPKYIM